MRTHSHESLSIATLLAAFAVSGCSLSPELGASTPSARLYTAGDPTGDDSDAGDDTGDPTSDDPNAGDPTSDNTNAGDPASDPWNAGDPTGDDATDPVATVIAAVQDGGMGLIVPAYLGVDATQQANWQMIADGAATLRNGTSKYKDYWVAVTAGDSGENKQNFDWVSAMAVWDRVRNNGGAIFGYVHTSQKWVTDPGAAGIDALLFRPVGDVEADIADWVVGYPNIDGIWIDEFYPRHEVADDNAPPKLMFPNGPTAAPPPKNPSYVSPDGGLDTSVNIDPAGGYYDQLRTWIRDTYPNLKIVGNAGGKPWSNQQEYARLVTVLCTFEDTYANAAAAGWKGLQRQNAASPYDELALIHTNPNDMAGALTKAFDLGYTHAYTTDVAYRGIDGGIQNLWGALPSYFMDEVTAVANLP